MAVAHDFERIDNEFYQGAEAFFRSYPGLALTYDDVTALIEKRNSALSTFRVVDASGKLAGLLSSHVVKQRYAKRKVADALTPRNQVHTISTKELGSNPIPRADKFFTDHPGIHKLLVVDEKDRLQGLFTMSDVEKITQEK